MSAVTTVHSRSTAARRICALLLMSLAIVAADASPAVSQEARQAEADAQAEREPVEVPEPFVFTAPTARLVPAGVIYPRVGIDSRPNFIGSLDIGLADFAEIGIVSTPYVRYERDWRQKAEYFDGYPMVRGRIGLSEGLLWQHQPAVALGYSRSFIITQFDRETHLSEITLTLSKQIGPWVSLTLGVQKWDGEIDYVERDPLDQYVLSDVESFTATMRPFGGLEVFVADDYSLLAEFYYMPEFEFAPADEEPEIELDATASLGVRAQPWPWLTVDAGVRGPDFTNLQQHDIEGFLQVHVPLRFLRGPLGYDD